MKNLTLLILGIFFLGCTKKQKNQDAELSALADRYYTELTSTYPQYNYFNDIQVEDHSLYGTNSLTDIKKWESFEDSLYSELLTINESRISNRSARITYWILKEELESKIEKRVCKRSLWDVNHMFGLHHLWTYLADFQPVENDTLKKQAFERWNKLPDVVQVEIENLKKGIEEGYTMPKEIVSIVIEQLQTLEDYPIDASPFMSPAKRAEDEKFSKEWENLVYKQVIPSFSRYRIFLQTEYMSSARDKVSILELPNGSECYKAFIRESTTTKKTGNEIFEIGKKIVEENKTKIRNIGKELYNSNDFNEIIELIGSDSSNYFKTSEEILEYNNKIMNAAKDKCKDWFSVLPSSSVTIKPYAAHESGIGSYEPATGNKPAYYRINLKKPDTQTYYSNETLSFHEAYPGHHLQIGIEKDIKGLHPIGSLVFFESYVEGWARYSEQLAEEMELYNYKATLISRRAWPSRGLVADPALHIHKWPKDSIINFMTESGMKEPIALSLYYRMIVYPAQLTSYDVGGEEIKALRSLAEVKLVDSFDIKEFHYIVLENGSIPLISLKSVVEDWIELKLTTTKDKMN
jgi:uncharacterized protein (DUF885 family)